jgi:pimeloyl-ACP methyl ester carboxylesterase
MRSAILAALLVTAPFGAGCASSDADVDAETSGALSDANACMPHEVVRDPNRIVRDGDGRLENHFIRVNGTCLHYVEAGPKDGKMVVLLHGVPSFWYSWRKQIAPLANAGYRVIVPDMRGFNESARPDPGDLQNYALRTVSNDIHGLIGALGADKADVVGHDIGGLVAWGLAMYHPERLRKLAVFDGPHPAMWRKNLLDDRNPQQYAHSWYVFAWSSAPRMTDAFMRGDFFGIGGGYREQLQKAMIDEEARARNAGAIDSYDVDLYAQVVKDHGNSFQSMEAYYGTLFTRGSELETEKDLLLLAVDAFRRYQLPLSLADSVEDLLTRPEKVPTPHFPTVNVPALVVFAEHDDYLVPAAMGNEADLRRLAPNVEVKNVPGISHWVLEDAPDTVNSMLSDFLTKP